MKRALLVLCVLTPTVSLAQQRLGPARLLEPTVAVQRVWVSAGYGPGTPGWQVSRFDLVQEAIDAVTPGGVVTVLPGTYLENVVVDRQLTLSGAGRDVTTINGGFDEDALRVEADGVTVQGLTLRCTNNAWLGPSGLLVRSSNNTIRDNSFEVCGYGLRIEPTGPPATGNLVEGNRTASNYRGMLVYDDGNTLRGNELSGDSIGIQVGSGVANTVIEDNTSSSNAWAIQLSGFSSASLVMGNQLGSGIYLEGTTGNTVTNNTVTGPLSEGIELFSSDGNTISDNVLVDVTYSGIGVKQSDGNHVTNNGVTGSGPHGIWILNSRGATVSGNNLDGGGISVESDQLDEWNSHSITGNEILGAPIEYHRDLVGPFTVSPTVAQVILANCSNGTIENTAFGNVDRAVQLGFCSSVIVQGCSVSNGPELAVAVTGSSDIVIAENDFGAGVLLNASSSVVRDNSLRSEWPSSSALWGISAFGPFADGNVFSGNEITGFLIGISASEQSNLTIENNLVRRSRSRGLSFFRNDGLVADNVVTGNLGGIDASSGVLAPPGIEFRNNLVSGNGPFGIEAGRFDVLTDNVLVGHDDGLVLTGDAIVADNIIAGNLTGIEAGTSTGSILHHNALVNDANAFDAGTNSWSDLGSGNYWHDYTGVDFDLNGIGDTPYAIPPTALDPHPLMEPPSDLMLWADGYALSYPTGGTIDIQLHAGGAQAGRPYLLLGSSTGRDGYVLPGGAVLPLVWDAFTDDIVANLNTAKYANFAGVLDADGEATAQLASGPLPPQLAGTTLWFAYTLQNPFDLVSVAINVEVGD